MNDSELRIKWDARYRDTPGLPAAPLEVLYDNRHLLPRSGRALDLACGLGGTALFLAGRGLDTSAWDLSAVAVDRLRDAAQGLPLIAEVRDVVEQPPEACRFDVICVGHFLERALCPLLSAALRPGGLLFYQTFTREAVSDDGPGNPSFRLETNELLRLFPDLLVRVYREEGRVGDTSRGFRNRAQLVAQRSTDPSA